MWARRFARALARHLHQAQLREAAHRGARAVARQLLAQLGQHGLLVVFLARHVDEVDDDDAAQVAQAQLARDGAGRFQVGLEDGVVEVARADEAAGVDVDRGQRLGLVDDQVAAALQVHAPASARAISSSMPNRSKIGRSPLYSSSLATAPGMKVLAKGLQRVELLALSMRMVCVPR
jgi:hypothetical protein